MTLRKNLKQINLHFFSTLLFALLNNIWYRGVLMELQMEKIRAKISMKDLMGKKLKKQTLFPYEK